MTLLDLAVKSECCMFVEDCCQGALDTKMYGDIDPYKNGFWNFLLTILSFGLLTGVRFPDEPILFGLIRIPREVLHYKPPPFDDVVRASTQRRETPQGFPGKPPQQGMHSDEKK